jgi:hypothetical protein
MALLLLALACASGAQTLDEYGKIVRFAVAD